jgi:hypothetical protein
MTIVYQGIRRKTTDVLDDYGQCQYLQNVRLKRVGELARRAGLGKSTMAQQAGPVQFMIGAWSNVPFIVNGTGGNVFGEEDPLAYWTAATMRKVVGVVGQPAAPVINFVTATPASPQPYPAGVISFSPNITYDGLSGPLLYSWAQIVGPAAPIPSISGVLAFDPNFDFFCIPSTYIFQLSIATTLNGFTDGPFSFNFVVS